MTSAAHRLIESRYLGKRRLVAASYLANQRMTVCRDTPHLPATP